MGITSSLPFLQSTKTVNVTGKDKGEDEFEIIETEEETRTTEKARFISTHSLNTEKTKTVKSTPINISNTSNKAKNKSTLGKKIFTKENHKINNKYLLPANRKFGQCQRKINSRPSMASLTMERSA